MRGTLAERLVAKIDRSGGPDACHPFGGSLDGRGYGSVYGGSGRGTVRAHVASWEVAHGPVPDGMVLDHVKARGCTMRRCCNVAHLEPVTMRENILRGDGWPAQARKTHCIHGHPFDEENTRITPDGHRDCRQCRRARVARWRQRISERVGG